MNELFTDLDPKLLEKFKQFHKENPRVYDLFVTYSKRMKISGKNKYSAWTIVNVIRWNMDLWTTGDVFKINNDFIAIYARVMIHNYPEFADFFELRQTKPTRKISFEEKARQPQDTSQQEIGL